MGARRGERTRRRTHVLAVIQPQASKTPAHRLWARMSSALLLMIVAICGTLACTEIVAEAQLEANETFLQRARSDEEGRWERLSSINADICAWLTVGGTGISEPVLAAAKDDAHFYLDHDAYGRPSSAGSVYLDARCTADGAALVVYGHRTGTGQRMFSDLRDAYEPESFAKIGTAVWETESGTTRFRPLCALKVNERWERLRPDGRIGRNAWLDDVSRQATAVSEQRRTLCATAQRVLILVTCSSLRSGQDSRTIVVFVAG